MEMSSGTIWLIIVVLGIGSFLIRFSFLGIVGARAYPAWVLRLLRYTPVAVLPALVAPLVAWPEATGGDPEPVRITAAMVTLAAGALSRNLIVAVMAGGGTLLGLQWILG
jgi:branched-subunit amino acid transport protein